MKSRQSYICSSEHRRAVVVKLHNSDGLEATGQDSDLAKTQTGDLNLVFQLR